MTDLFNTQKQDIQINYQGVDMTSQIRPETRFVNLSFAYKFGNNKGKTPKQKKLETTAEESRMKL